MEPAPQPQKNFVHGPLYSYSLQISVARIIFVTCKLHTINICSPSYFSLALASLLEQHSRDSHQALPHHCSLLQTNDWAYHKQKFTYFLFCKFSSSFISCSSFVIIVLQPLSYRRPESLSRPVMFLSIVTVISKRCPFQSRSCASKQEERSQTWHPQWSRSHCNAPLTELESAVTFAFSS